LEAVDTPARDLLIFADLLARFEREPFSSPRLVSLRAELATEGQDPSKQIARLQKLIEVHDWAHNQFFRPMARLMLWSTQFAIAIESWRRKSGPSIARWLLAVGELEALTSLAGYAYDHPDDVYPELTERQPLFDARGLAHPLLPLGGAVRNDVCLDGELRLLLVSGSNMSGKSTLLRAVGLNAVLAWAGAPVRAERLAISDVAIGASIRILDSLHDGKSRFYAEITRLRQIMDLAAEPRPLLFLLDELLSGTNSHDRRIGAEGVVRTLVARGAMGLVTTHDLALAEVAEALQPNAANVHFEDHLENGVIAFDYKMRPGIIQKSNALELMRSVGLEV
jgi:DNA mismatch repair ATPase MutS